MHFQLAALRSFSGEHSFNSYYLSRHCLAQHQEDPEPRARSVRSVRPQSMRAACRSDYAEDGQ